MKHCWIVVVLVSLAFTGCASTSSQNENTNDAQDATVAPTQALATATTAALTFGSPAPATPTLASTRATAAGPGTPTLAPTSASTRSLATPTQAPAAAPATPTRADAVATRVVPPAGQINLPSGFGISVFASNLSAPRMMTVGPDGQLYAAERGAARVVRLPDRNRDGVADGVEVVASGLTDVNSLAFFRDGSLYLSTATQVLRLSQPDANGVYQKRDVVIDGLPGHIGHFTRTLAFSPDWSSLYVQIGSSCNACVESDSRRATIMRFNVDGSGGQIYARGLRNAVGLTFRPGTNELWASNNGRDNLGDNEPPDTIHLVQQGQDYGWPRCDAGRIVTAPFGGPGACDGIAKPVVEMQAHSAALGLTFYTGTQFPADYRGDLFVAFHGSIYRNVPTGYKVVRIHFTNGQPGHAQDFATGWLLPDNTAWGRPVDVLTAPDGSLWISDDSRGNIYRIFYIGG